jgi:hypothetical protein
MRLPGCKKLRGTQLGAKRKMPSPASKARFKILPTLSLATTVEVLIERIGSTRVGQRPQPVDWQGKFARHAGG